ncbi:DNA polymerase III, delta subunit, partial [Vibrio parahaemolyticus V-223/04]
FLRV